MYLSDFASSWRDIAKRVFYEGHGGFAIASNVFGSCVVLTHSKYIGCISR